MKLIFSCLLTFLVFFSSTAQEHINTYDSSKLESNQIKAELVVLKQTNDSLNRESIKNLSKVEFYTSRYSDLATQFEWFVSIMVGFLVAAGGVLVWKFYQADISKVKYEIQAQKEEILRQKEEIVNLINQEAEEMRILRADHHRQMYNVLYNTAIDTNMIDISRIQYYMNALHNITLAYECDNKNGGSSYLQSLKITMKSSINCCKRLRANKDKIDKNKIDISLILIEDTKEQIAHKWLKIKESEVDKIGLDLIKNMDSTCIFLTKLKSVQ